VPSGRSATTANLLVKTFHPARAAPTPREIPTVTLPQLVSEFGHRPFAKAMLPDSNRSLFTSCSSSSSGVFSCAERILLHPGVTRIPDDPQQPGASILPMKSAEEPEGAQIGFLQPHLGRPRHCASASAPGYRRRRGGGRTAVSKLASLLCASNLSSRLLHIINCKTDSRPLLFPASPNLLSGNIDHGKPV